jgi:hypothetical protein
VDRWPPLQYIPALTVKRFGASRVGAAHTLIYLNGLAVLFVLGLLWQTGRRSRAPALGPIFLLAGIVSPLLWYGDSGFGEAFAAAAATCLVASITLRWPPAIAAVALWLTIASKETALPFAVALAALALLVDAPRRAGTRRYVAAIGVGMVAGVATIAGFNLIRYGVPWNRYYVQSGWAVPGLPRRAEYFAAEIAAPNAGLIWFWPVASALIAVGAFQAANAIRRRQAFRSRHGLTVGVLLVLVVLLASFASWWGPFGWAAWGDRLIVPWIPAILVLLAATAGPELGAALSRVAGSKLALLAAAAATLVLGLAELAAFASPLRPFGLFKQSADCPPIPNVFERYLSGDPVAHRAFEHCQSTQLWHRPPVLADVLHSLRGGWVFVAVLYATAVIGLLMAAARTSRAAIANG